LTLNISQTATDTAIVTIEGKYETAPKLSNGTNFNDLDPDFKFTVRECNPGTRVPENPGNPPVFKPVNPGLCAVKNPGFTGLN